MKKIYIALFATFTFINCAVCTPVDNAKKLIQALNSAHDQNSAHEFSEEGQKLDREHQKALEAHDMEEQELIQLHKTELKKHDEEERQKLTEDRDRELNLHEKEKQRLDQQHQETLEAHDMEEQELIQLHETELKKHDEEKRQKLGQEHQEALKQHEEKRQRLIYVHKEALSKHKEKGQHLSEIHEKRILEHKQKTEDLAQKHKQLLIDHQTKRQHLIDTHKKNLEDKKQIITTKHDVLKKDHNRIFLTTITRYSAPQNKLISHEELEQVLHIAYALCNKTPPTPYDAGTTTLNNSIGSKLKTGEDVKVNTLCTNIKSTYTTKKMDEAYNIIIFDEMFFSQACPLTDDQKTFIEDKIKHLSYGITNTFFYVNFLYIQNILIKNSLVHSNATKINNGKNVFDDAIAKSALAKSVLAISNNETEQLHKSLKNETCAIYNNNVLTTYKKATYFEEADSYFYDPTSPVVLYDFGDGEDHGDHKNNISNAMLKNISTEICFDLPNAIRKTNAWTNKSCTLPHDQSNLHIIQSNIVDTDEVDNKKNLPTDRFVAHSDCTHGKVFYKNNPASVAMLSENVDIGDSKYKIEIHEIK